MLFRQLTLVVSLVTLPIFGQSSQALKILAAQRHIWAGAAADAAKITGAGCALEPQYCALLGNEYNLIVPENAMKFDTIHPAPGVYDFSQADALVAFAQAHGMKVRGHTLVWWQQVPAWVENGGFNTQQLEAILQDHITTVVSHFKSQFPGMVVEWDVVNEGAYLGIWGQIGTLDQVAAMAFAWAHAADPSAKLYYNDFGDEDDSSAKSTWVYDLVTRLKAGGTPIDGVGLQSHFPVSGVPSLQEMEANLQRYASAGLEAKFTELDVRLADNTAASLSAQAGAYSQVMNACLAVSSCKGVVTWGFTDEYSWVPQAFPGYGWALPFDSAYNTKPAYTALQQALDAGVPGAAGTTVTISAYGTPMGGVYPHMEVRAGGALIGAWDVTGSPANYTTTTTADLTANNLRVYFTNDAYSSREDRNLMVLSLAVNQTTYPTASPWVYGSGVWANGCSSGYVLTSTLYCAGYFEYPTSGSMMPSQVTVRAYGTPLGGVYPRIELRHGGSTLASWQVSATAQDYTVVTTDNLSAGNLRVYYTNDAYSASEDRNLTVLSVTVNGAVYPSMSPLVFGLGIWSNNQCNSGYIQTNTLYCGGYFEFPTALKP